MSFKASPLTPEPTPEPECNLVEACLQGKAPVSSSPFSKSKSPESHLDDKVTSKAPLKGSEWLVEPIPSPDDSCGDEESNDNEESGDQEVLSTSLVYRRERAIPQPLNSGYEAFRSDGEPRCQGYAVTKDRQCLKGIDCDSHPYANRQTNALSSLPVLISNGNQGTPSSRPGYEALKLDGKPRCQGYAVTKGRQCLKGIDCDSHPYANRQTNALSSSPALINGNQGTPSSRPGYEALKLDGKPRCQGYAVTKGRQCLKGIDCDSHPYANRQTNALSSSPALINGNQGTPSSRPGYEALKLDGKPRCQGYAVTKGRQCLKGIDCDSHPYANRQTNTLSSLPVLISNGNQGTPKSRPGYEAVTGDGEPRCQGYAITKGRQCLFPAAKCRYH